MYFVCNCIDLTKAFDIDTQTYVRNLCSEKTCYVPCTCYDYNFPPFKNINVNTVTTIIPEVKVAKHLGIEMDCHLIWD